jgi:glycosyltransferase involved in cell wall biosynthesis
VICVTVRARQMDRVEETGRMVSAIIPARNEEASIARAVESVAAEAEVGEVIVVNDQSTDRTGEILTELAAGIPKLRVLETGALPTGWTGKNYALSMGAATARGNWLLFTDADTFHLPGSTAHALADAREHDAALVSYSPEQEMETFWERALIPYVYCRLAAKYSYARVNDPDLPEAAANGQFLLVRRNVYESVGGHAVVAPQILEDVALAQTVKNAGHAIFFSNPMGVVRARMYRGFEAMWEGWTKNLYWLFPKAFDNGEMRVAGIGSLIGLVALALTKSVLVAVVSASLGALIGWHVWYALALRRNRLPIKYIQYGLVGNCLFIAAWIVSAWKNTRGEVKWKGRTYPARSS